MIVKCEACGTRYRLEDSRVKPEGVKVRCSRCGHVFTVFPEAPPVEGPREEPLPDEEIFGDVSSLAPEEGVALPEERKGLPKLALVLLIVMLALLAVALLFINRERIPFVRGLFGKVAQMIEAKERLFPLSELKGYRLVVDGTEVFVIEGRVSNQSREPCRYVKLRGRLLDARGRRVAEGVASSGRHIPRKRLQGMDFPLLKDLARNQSPSGLAPLAPGDSASFTIVFLSPPKGATDFQVEVVETPVL